MPPYAEKKFDTVATDEVGPVAVAYVEPTKLSDEEAVDETAMNVDEKLNTTVDTELDSLCDEDDNKSTEAGSTASATGNAFEMLMDFNPCMVMQSAVFKVRNCNHCGDGCTKVGFVFCLISKIKSSLSAYFASILESLI